MSDAACDQNSNKQVVGTSCSAIIEEHWRKGVILLQIWREVLRVILFAGGPGEGLDEKSKREMWLLLVAAGSGYLARCWHKTLKTKPQLTDHSHEDPVSQNHQCKEGDEQAGNSNNLLATPSSSSQPLLLGERNESTLNATRFLKSPELAPKALKRSFSPKALGKKLFASDTNKGSKSFRKESSLSPSLGKKGSSSADVGKEDKLPASGGDASPSVGHSGSRRWSSFKSLGSSKPPREGSPGLQDDDDSSTESAPGCLKRAGDSFRKSRDRKKSDSGSLSSRSLQGLLSGDGGDGGSASAGSSRREMEPPDYLYSSSGLTNRSLSSLGPSLATEISEPSSVGESPEVTSERIVAESELKVASPDAVNQNSYPTIRKEGPLTSVAEVVARIEKSQSSAKADTVNAILSIRAANQAHAQALPQAQPVIAVTDSVKVRTSKLELEQDSFEEAESVPGGKGKKRAGDGGGKVGGGSVGERANGGGLPAPLITGKRTKDSKDSKDSTKSESSGVTLTSITGKWKKDLSFMQKESPADFKESALSPGLGAVDLSQVFFGFDSTFLTSPIDEKVPFKCDRRSRAPSRSGRSNMRKMRESPKPISALESCLRAQIPHKEIEGSRVARSLNFSSSSISHRSHQLGSLDSGAQIPFQKHFSYAHFVSSSSDARGFGGGRAQQSPQQTEGALGLPLLVTPPSSGSASRGWARGFSSSRGSQQSVESASKYPRKVVLEQRGRVVSGESKLSDVVWRPTTLPVAPKKRRVSQACSPAANSGYFQSNGYEVEALVIPPMEGLLFSFGVGIGVMSLIDEEDNAVERLTLELQKSEEKIENLNNLLREARETSVVQATASLSKEIVSLAQTTGSLSKEIVVVGLSPSEELIAVEVSSNLESPLDPQSITPAIQETGREFDLYRREAPETPQQFEQMAELEAELEAELNALTNGIDIASGPPDFEELDPEGVAGVADRDLGVEGLPAVVDWDDDNDDFITEEPVHSGGGVPPRELSRLLRKVQNSRQEYRIVELEADLHETSEKLQAMERELQLLREKIASSAPPSAGTTAEDSDLIVRDVFEGVVQNKESSWSDQIEQLNQSMFEDQESRRYEKNRNGEEMDASKGEMRNMNGVEIATNISVRGEHGSKLLGSVASEPISSVGGLVDGDGASHLATRAASEPASSGLGDLSHGDVWDSGTSESLISYEEESVSSEPTSKSEEVAVAKSEGSMPNNRSMSSMILSDESMKFSAQADNDAVCDEFLSSVFGSPDGSQLGLSSSMSSPLVDLMPLANTPIEQHRPAELPKEVPLESMASGVGEDLDQVVGQLLKKDSSSVKNAINAFLRWEASEKDEAPSKDDTGEDDGGINSISRRTAGKNPTPQKTPLLAAMTPQKTSVISSRLEQLARSAFTSEKMPYVEKPAAGTAKRLGLIPDDNSPRIGGRTIQIYQQQPAQFKLEDKSLKPMARREYPLARKDHSPLTQRRTDVGKGEGSMTETLRDLFRSDSPVFGSGDRDFQGSPVFGGSNRDQDSPVFGGGERDFQYLFDSRRELRYQSSKVQLSLTGPPDIDRVPVYRQRDDPSRAGTNSPIGRQLPVKNAFQSPKLKHSRMALENRLYQNPTSDWLAEVGSPPDL